MDNYAIKILEKEIYLLSNCLSDWHISQYPEAKKEREIKLKELKEAIKKLKL